MPSVIRLTQKETLYWRGYRRLEKFCNVNDIYFPTCVTHKRDEWHFCACAYYRPEEIHICLEECASPATENQVRNWNWPGTLTDREPYGVLCHELGHHCDMLASETKYRYSGSYSINMMKESGERPITSYCPNPAEWFAEMMRLFVTNASLLKLVRPKTHALISKRWTAVSHDDWQVELGEGVPSRILNNILKKIG